MAQPDRLAMEYEITASVSGTRFTAWILKSKAFGTLVVDLC